MKGLLRKDLSILLCQKRFLRILILWGIFFLFMKEEVGMATGYITMIVTIFSLSTISYDEYDKGMTYLLTLPINRKLYVGEKYLFSCLISAAACVISTVLTIVVSIVKKPDFVLQEVLVISVVMLMMSLCILAFAIPFQIKYGAEKGRIVMMVISVGIGTLIVCIARIVEKIGGTIDGVTAFIYKVPPALLLAAAMLILLLIVFASYLISAWIITKKEY